MNEVSSNSAYQRYQSKLFFGSSHAWAKDKINSLGPKSRILDVGPGSGVIGKLLRDAQYTTLFAIEPDEVTAELLKPDYEKIVSNLVELNEHEIEMVILLDVLEHMDQPEAFLQEIKPHLKDSALLLVSVPNIAHWSVRLPLLFGQFEYTERGLLDRTHLQFFTRRRIHNIFRHDHNYKLIETSSSIEPLEFLVSAKFQRSWLFRSFAKIRWKLSQVAPGLFAYQHLCLVRFSHS